ncbi:hypothetical protein E5288_WYG004684 [Bos mutus]|uniref:Initiation factor eIF2 gamma C-terminal domain-containing protein n=1 Tax=Bos mutus TaxID=72004 RepID=A0A6B0RQU2_9CETA|nr:hypothetical protein [Bos mutus]
MSLYIKASVALLALLPIMEITSIFPLMVIFLKVFSNSTEEVLAYSPLFTVSFKFSFSAIEGVGINFLCNDEYKTYGKAIVLEWKLTWSDGHSQVNVLKYFRLFSEDLGPFTVLNIQKCYEYSFHECRNAAATAPGSPSSPSHCCWRASTAQILNQNLWFSRMRAPGMRWLLGGRTEGDKKAAKVPKPSKNEVLMVNTGSLSTGGGISAVKADLGKIVLTNSVCLEVEEKNIGLSQRVEKHCLGSNKKRSGNQANDR